MRLEDAEQALEGDLFGPELFRGCESEQVFGGEKFICQAQVFTLLMDAKSGLIGALGGEAVFELAKEVEVALPVQAPGKIHIGNDVRGATHAILIGAGLAQFAAIEHLDLPPRGGAFVEVMQDEHADAMGVELDFGESVKEAQGGTNAGDVVIGHVGQVAGEHVEDDQAGGIGLEAVEKTSDRTGIADVEGIEVEGDVFAEKIFFIRRQTGS